MATIQFRCGDELKTQLDQLARQREMSASAVARLFVEALVTRNLTKEEKNPLDPAKAEQSDPEYERRDQIVTIRLTKSENKKVVKCAKASGVGRSTWVMRLIRASLTKRAQLTPVEVEALRLATRELSYVGRNLNQVAHNLNISLNAKDQATAALIHDTHEKVAAMQKEIKNLLDENVNRWGV
jgi:predicted DNA binding CopG/RHH family protein